MGDQEFSAILIYDGDCPFCSAASTAVRHLEDVGVIAWDDPAAQAFLEAQFGERPFAMFFVDREVETVWAGKAAARELCHRAGMPVFVEDVVDENYERVADAIRSVAGLESDVDPYNDAYPLADSAADCFGALASKGDRTHGLHQDGDGSNH